MHGREQDECSAHIFELQRGIPADGCLSIHLPRTDLDKQGMFQARRKATICGNMLSVGQQYLWGAAELLEGCQADNVDIFDWNNQSHPVVKFSLVLAIICRHDKDFAGTQTALSAWKNVSQKEGPRLHLVSCWPWYTRPPRQDFS